MDQGKFNLFPFNSLFKQWLPNFKLRYLFFFFFSQAFFNPIIVMPLFFIRQHDVCVDEKGVQDRWGVSLMNVKLKSILSFLSFLPPYWSIVTKYENFVFTIN